MSSKHGPRRRVRLFAVASGLCLGLLTASADARAGDAGARPRAAFKLTALHSSKAQPARASAEPFALATSAVGKGGLVDQWRAVVRALDGERRVLLQCRTSIEACPHAAKRYLAIIDKALTREGLARIGEINRAINLNIRSASDMAVYGVPEKWATPLMTFAAGAGDCEDYAIAKYVALREVGFAPADVRLVVVHDRIQNEDHAVAAVRYESRWLILDNRTLDMRTDAQATQFDPMFVLDSQGVRRLVAGAARQARARWALPPLDAVGEQVLSENSPNPFFM